MEAPWLEHYDEGVPASVGPYPERTLLDDLADGVAQRPDAPALLFKGRTVTWRRPGRDPDERRHHRHAQGRGRPAPPLHHHRRQLGTWLQAGTTPWDDVIMAALPLFHSFANVGIQSVALRNHNAMALVPDPRDLDDLLGTIARTRPTAFSGVPTLVNALLHHPKVRAGKLDFSSVKVCFSGGGAAAGRDQAPLRGADRRALAAHRRPRLPGRRRLPVHRRPHQGPHQDPRLPGVAARDRGGAGHPPGGGRGGRGRRPRRGQGRGGKAWVVLRTGERAEVGELRAFCRERLAPYKVPATVEFRSELPNSMVGKVLRRALTEPGSAP